MVNNNYIRKVRKTMLILLAVLCAFVLLAIAMVTVFRSIHAREIKIDTGKGIQENMYVEIGGIEQYLQIRGDNHDNPVILWLHGGPGFPLTYLNYYYQRDLEKDYTIVCWEQRGCGRTYYKNRGNDELIMEQLLSDTGELVDYLRERFHQEKIIIIGQSWGTVLGMNYIHEHSDKVAAYIGVGQVVDFAQGKIYAAECASMKATESKNDEEAKLLKRCAEQFKANDSVKNMDVKSLEKMIITSLKYLKCDGELSPMQQMLIAVTSPEMSWDDAKWFLFASSTENIFKSQYNLVDDMYFQFDVTDLESQYDIPICFIQGDSDWITPTDLVREYYLAISADCKDMIEIENAGHTPFLDNPDSFCSAVHSFLSKCQK